MRVVLRQPEPVDDRAVQLPEQTEPMRRGAVDGEGDDGGVVVAASVIRGENFV